MATAIILRNSGATQSTVYVESSTHTYYEAVPFGSANGGTISRGPGEYRIHVRDPRDAHKTLSTELRFDVDSVGAVSVHESVAQVLRVDKNTLTLVAIPLQLDFSGHSHAALRFAGISGLSLQPTNTLGLLPGQYTLLADGQESFEFTLLPSGDIQFAPELTGVLQRTAKGLLVTGVKVQIDARKLVNPKHYLTLSGLRDFLSTDVQRLTLLPGSYQLLAKSSQGDGSRFIIEPAGTVSIDPADRESLRLDTGNIVSVLGYDVQIDARELSYQNFHFDEIQSPDDPRSRPSFSREACPLALRLLPGQYGYRGGSGTSADPRPGYIKFSLSRAGRFEFAKQIEDNKILERGGNRALLMHGFEVQIDGRAVARKSLRVEGIHLESDPAPADQVLVLRLIGTHSLSHTLCIDEAFRWAFCADEYKAALTKYGTSCWEAVVTGWDTNKVTIHGASIQLDLTLLWPLAEQFCLVSPSGKNQPQFVVVVGPLTTREPQTLQLAPGQYYILRGPIAEKPPTSRPPAEVQRPALQFVVSGGAGTLSLSGTGPQTPFLTIRDKNTVQVGMRLSGPAKDWKIDSGLVEGDYTATLTVENGEGWHSERVSLTIPVHRQ